MTVSRFAVVSSLAAVIIGGSVGVAGGADNGLLAGHPTTADGADAD